ncbi:MAG TPA: hypothetical protein VL284_10590 [Thermoanaerobaculia bacterium]|nr:hypothetical protein [Thermoanaerobaculia bacterium]
MGRQKKITVTVPEELIERARKDAHEGISDTVREALELRANQHAWERLARWRGRVKWSVSLSELRKDRD